MFAASDGAAMKILLTGASSGLGACLKDRLIQDHQVLCPDRSQMDLCDHQSIWDYAHDLQVDMLINCAGTGIGGKIAFDQHRYQDIDRILRTNLLGPVLLSRLILAKNVRTKIVNITSTNNNRYHANDLTYSLSKQALETFGSMLTVEYPALEILQIRLGLTKTQFNHNRYRHEAHRYQDIYCHPHLLPDRVAGQILDILFDPSIKHVEISP